MEQQIRIVSAGEVKALIAGGFLSGLSDVPSQLGSVTLHSHQASAVQRIIPALEEFGGALLCDEVGMGKTFVALAVARTFRRCLIIAPAALRDMWRAQCERAGMQLPFISFESLSRGRDESPFDLVIVDEAHHARNRATIRYRTLSRMLARSKVLMLSATPVHNKKKDITALLSIFLGSRAESLTEPELTRCVIKRRLESIAQSTAFPAAETLAWQEIDADDEIPRQLLALAPPVPASDGGDGGVLVARGLLRQWCSSDAALNSALRRRLARALALSDVLESGRYPTEQELAAWTFAEDSMQLAFPSFVATSRGDCGELLIAVRQHTDALRQVLGSLGTNNLRDQARAEILKRIRADHQGVPVVAFSQYAETVHALFRELRAERGVAELTARGARVAGGSISRREALARFAPKATGATAARYAERIDLLLATDLLSEGVNLQDAGVVVHLDLPWTAARLEQRIGRVRRLGSVHHSVYVYGIRPSGAAESLIGLERTIRKKIALTDRWVGKSTPVMPADKADVVDSSLRDPLSVSEGIRAILTDWLSGSNKRHVHQASDEMRVGAVAATRCGFVALCGTTTETTLVGSDGTSITESPAVILELLLSIEGESVVPGASAVTRERESLNTWLAGKRVLSLTEIEGSTLAQTRRRTLARISTIAQNARPHARQRILRLAEHARRGVLGRLGTAAEAELRELTDAKPGDEEWLHAVIRLCSPPGECRRLTHDSSTLRGVALLLLHNSKRTPLEIR